MQDKQLIDKPNDDSKDEINKDELKDHFEKRFNQSGFTLEDKVEKILYNEFYGYRRNAIYIDKDENKDRTIDFMVATPCYWIPMKKSEHLTINLDLIIECKKLPHHAWIFSGKESRTLPLEYLILGPKNKKLEEFIPAENVKLKEVIPSINTKLFTANNWIEKFYKDEKKRHKGITIQTNQKENNLKDAIMKITKATRYRMDFRKKENEELFNKKKGSWFNKKKTGWYGMYIFQPLIIFEGEMYCTSEQNGKSELTPIKFAKIEKEYKSDNYNEKKGEIHIVSFSAIDDYLKFLKSTINPHEPPVEFMEMFGADRHRKGFL